MVKNGNFTFLLLQFILANEVAGLPSWYWLLVVKNGDFSFLLLELILADEVADLLADLPPVLTSSGQEWEFYISSVTVHIGK